MRMFIDPDRADDQNVSLLLATIGVANVGLDSLSLRLEIRYDFTLSALGITQEAG